MIVRGNDEIKDPEFDGFFEVKIPKIFVIDPKMIIETDIVIRPVEPIKFISLRATIEKEGIKFDG